MSSRRGNREGSFTWEPPSGRRKYGRVKGTLLLTGVGRLVVAGRKGESKASVRERLFAKRDEYGTVRHPTRNTVAEWCDTWLRLYVKDKGERTREYYRDRLRPLFAVIGKEPLNGLAPERLLLALDSIERPASRRKAYEVLRIALNRAVRAGRLKANVCNAIDPPAFTPKVVEPPTKAEVDRILAAVRGQRDEALIVVALATGLRQGEIVGLRWKDVELGREDSRGNAGLAGGSASRGIGGAGLRDGGRATPALRVAGQLNRQRQYVGAKRGSERIVPLPPLAAAALTAHRERVTLAQGRRPGPEDYVFLDAKGRPMTGFEAHRRWDVVCKAAGVDKTFHSARHWAHTRLDEAGVSRRVVDALFGHSDARAGSAYTHATDEARQVAAEVMERALTG